MLGTRFGRVAYLLLAGALVLGALVLLRAPKKVATEVRPGQDLRRGGESYRHRLQETDRLLDSDAPFDIGSR